MLFHLLASLPDILYLCIFSDKLLAVHMHPSCRTRTQLGFRVLPACFASAVLRIFKSALCAIPVSVLRESLACEVLWSAADKRPRMVASIPDTSMPVAVWEPYMCDVTTVHSPYWPPQIPSGRIRGLALITWCPLNSDCCEYNSYTGVCGSILVEALLQARMPLVRDPMK